MNIGHHRKGNVGQAHCRAGVHNNDDDGYNKVEARNDNDAGELEMGNGGMGGKDKENRERGTNNNGKAFGSGEHTPHRANTKIQLRVSGGMWAIIIVAAVCMIPVWLGLYSLIWTGGRDVISFEEKMLSPHLVHVQHPLAIIDPHKTDAEGSGLPSDTVAAASNNVSEGIKSSLVASNDERELKAPSVVRGQKDDSNSASNITMIVFTHSRPSGRNARDKQRSFCRPLYERYGIKHMFSVGKPSFASRPRDSHVQGELPTEEEISVSRNLMEEHKQHGDIFLTPNRDHYRDKSEKLLSSLRYTVEQDVDFILKTDDEYCIDIDLVKQLVRARQGTRNEIYLGNYLWKGTEYTIMQGSDGTIAPFMSGWVFGLSQNLAKTIVKDWMHSILVAPYGTSSDDANLGKWVDWAIHNHNLTVDYVAEQRLLINIPDPEKKEDGQVPAQVQVNCGGHSAASCADCQQDHGAVWCNGDCSWSDEGVGVCQLKIFM